MPLSVRQAFEPEILTLQPEVDEGGARPGQKYSDEVFYTLVEMARRASSDPNKWLVYSHHRSRASAYSRRHAAKLSERSRRLPLNWRAVPAPTADNPDRYAVVFQWDARAAEAKVVTSDLGVADLVRFRDSVMGLFDAAGRWQGGELWLPWRAVYSEIPDQDVLPGGGRAGQTGVRPGVPESPRVGADATSDVAESGYGGDTYDDEGNYIGPPPPTSIEAAIRRQEAEERADLLEVAQDRDMTVEALLEERRIENEEREERRRRYAARTPHEAAIPAAENEARRFARDPKRLLVSDYEAGMRTVMRNRGLDGDWRDYAAPGFLGTLRARASQERSIHEMVVAHVQRARAEEGLDPDEFTTADYLGAIQRFVAKFEIGGEPRHYTPPGFLEGHHAPANQPDPDDPDDVVDFDHDPEFAAADDDGTEGEGDWG